MLRLGTSDLEVFELCLGGNVFGWTADEPASFAVLDAYLDAGGNFIDTADSYSAFVPGYSGGESEMVLGQWLAARDNREQVVLATKVGRKPDRMGLGADNIRQAVDEALARLQTDYVDLLYAHRDDPDTALEETLGAFDGLVREGKVRWIAASNYEASRLEAALRVSDEHGWARFVALQPHYSLVERGHYEGPLADLCLREHLSAVPYWALARGFLTGKYRPGVNVDSPRAHAAGAYLSDDGIRVLDAVQEVADGRSTTMAAVALAWVAAQPGVASPIASARNTEQLAQALPMATLRLSAEELTRLHAASTPRQQAA
jgi:aryl-alcohol dehydrogenase-like predicted oxidoreductase